MMRRTESVAVAVLIGLVAVACSTTSTPTTELKDSVAQIAFNSDRDGNFEVYVMDADGSNPTSLTNGSNPTRLTNNPALDGFAA